MPKPIIAKINKGDFQVLEAFASREDAEAWRTMVETTLEHRDRFRSAR